MFTSNNTSDEEFAEALGGPGCILNLDDITHIGRLPGRFPELISFRYNPGNRRTSHGKNPIGKPYMAKYGITHAQCVPSYREAMRRGAKEFGIHTMICSNERKATYFIETIKMMLGIAGLLQDKLDINLPFINIGGGFGIPHRPTQKELDIEKIGEAAAILLGKFGDERGYIPALYTECGRYVTGPHGVLVTKVINSKEIYRSYLGVDACMSSLMRPAMYGAYHHIEFVSPTGKVRTGPTRKLSLVGSICENIDRFADNREFPRSARIGDFAAIAESGAHSYAMTFNYNGRTRPQQLLRTSADSVSLIRRAEVPDDLFQCFDSETRQALSFCAPPGS